MRLSLTVKPQFITTTLRRSLGMDVSERGHICFNPLNAQRKSRVPKESKNVCKVTWPMSSQARMRTQVMARAPSPTPG